MKVSTSTSNIVSRFGHETAMNIFGEAGFEALDYGMFHLAPDGELFAKADDAEFAEYFKNVRRMAAENGLEIGQTHAPFPLKIYDDSRDPILLACAIRSIYATAYLDCPYVVVHPGMKPAFIYGMNYEECKRTNVEFYSAMVPAIRETGVRVAIENMFAGDPETHKLIPTTCSTAAWMIDLIDTLNDIHGGELFVACLDTGHAIISGSGATNMLLELGGRTKVLHVQDNDGLSDMHQIPGRGKINWQRFLDGLKTVGYNGTFNFEADNFYHQWSAEINGEPVARAAAKTLYTVGRTFANQL